MQRVYLDNSATTKVDPVVLEAMKPYFTADFGNPSSIHSSGQSARATVDGARKTIAKFLNCESSELIFTSGGSESNNLAIKGIVDSFSNPKSEYLNPKQTLNPNDQNQKPKKLKSYTLKPNLPHIITSSFEHHAVLDTVKELEKEGKIEATYINPNDEGIIDVSDIESAITDRTILISIMYVNNEIGTVQPIREIGKMIERVNSQRYKKQDTRNKQIQNSKSQVLDTKYSIHNTGKDLPKILFHTDAVQATSYFNMNVQYLHVDLLTISAHKIHGPKGIGALYIKKNTPIKHQIVGGGQEFKLRAGTENVPGIVGFAKAIEQINIENDTHRNNTQKGHRIPDFQNITNIKIRRLRDRLIDGLLKIEKTKLNGSKEHRSPNNVNVSFDNAEGESILINLDMEGIAVSSGSACTSGSLKSSHVLTAIGVPKEKSHGSIRFSLCRYTTKEEIDKVIKVMPRIIKKLREMSPIR